MAPVRVGLRVGPRGVGLGFRPYRRGWGWGRRRRGFGVFGLLIGLIVLGVFAFFICTLFGMIAFLR